MLRLIGIVLSIGFADSLNPTTIGPALLLSTGKRARHTVLMFALGAFSVYFLGGLLIAFGPGELILALLPRLTHNTVQIIEAAAGVVLILAGTLLWRHRVALAEREIPVAASGRRTGFWLGAGIMLLELPTAFPYFGALAAVISTHPPLLTQTLLILLFNLVFIWPMLAIYVILWIYGSRAEEVLTRYRRLLQRHWPLLLAGIALLAGGVVITLGATGIIRRTKLILHSRRLIARIIRKLR